MTLNLNVPGNMYLDAINHDWKVAVNDCRWMETVELHKNPSFVAGFKAAPIAKTFDWDFENSMFHVTEGLSMDLPCNAFTDIFQGDVWHIRGVWGMKHKMKMAFLNAIYAHIKGKDLLFHMTEKTRECIVYVGTKEQFEVITGVVKASKFKKLMGAIQSVVDRYSINGLPSMLKMVAIDPTKFGYSKHVSDGSGGIFRRLEYIGEFERYEVGAAQSRIYRKPGGVIKVAMAFGVAAHLQYADAKRYIDTNLPNMADVDGYMFMENIKGGFADVKHGDIITVDSATELVVLKKAKAPGCNTSNIGGQCQIAAVTQLLQFKKDFLAKSHVHHHISLMKDIFNTGNLDALYELGFSKGTDVSKIISRLMFDDMRDRRTIEVHKIALYKQFLDRVRKVEHHDRTWSAYSLGLIGLGLAEKLHHEKTGDVKFFAITPAGCDIESLCARYPAASNHSLVAITPIHILKVHDVVMVANSVSGWIGWMECNMGDFDGDMVAIYRGNEAEYKNLVPNMVPLTTDKGTEPAEYIDGIIDATNAAILAKASISESDRAARLGYMFMFVNMIEKKFSLSIDQLVKLNMTLATARENEIKSQKRTDIKGQTVSTAKKILAIFPQPNSETSELGTEFAKMMFELTTADAGAGGDALENVKFDAVLAMAQRIMLPKYAKYHGIIDRFPFVKNIIELAKLDFINYNQLDCQTLLDMNAKGKALMATYINDGTDIPEMKLALSRLAKMQYNFNSAMGSSKENYAAMIKTLAQFDNGLGNPMFGTRTFNEDDKFVSYTVKEELSTIPVVDIRWSIQADGIRDYLNAIGEKISEDQIMVYIGLIMTGWDNWDAKTQTADKFEGFNVTHSASGAEFRRRGHIFWMMPKEWIARAAFALAKRDEDGNICNPFLKNAESPAYVVDIMDNYVEDFTEFQFNEGAGFTSSTGHDEQNDNSSCLNYI